MQDLPQVQEIEKIVEIPQIQTVEKLAAKGITNTDQLFAKFLSYLNEPKEVQSPKKAEAFYNWMKNEAKIKGGWIPTLIDQMVQKFELGIDSGYERDPRTEEKVPRTRARTRQNGQR